MIPPKTTLSLSCYSPPQYRQRITQFAKHYALLFLHLLRLSSVLSSCAHKCLGRAGLQNSVRVGCPGRWGDQVFKEHIFCATALGTASCASHSFSASTTRIMSTNNEVRDDNSNTSTIAFGSGAFSGYVTLVT